MEIKVKVPGCTISDSQFKILPRHYQRRFDQFQEYLWSGLNTRALAMLDDIIDFVCHLDENEDVNALYDYLTWNRDQIRFHLNRRIDFSKNPNEEDTLERFEN